MGSKPKYLAIELFKTSEKKYIEKKVMLKTYAHFQNESEVIRRFIDDYYPEHTDKYSYDNIDKVYYLHEDWKEDKYGL